MATLNIMDVSKWQGTIDWDKVKASGKVDGVILRVLGSKGGKPYVDPTFEVNYKACIESGIPVGAYYYSAATLRSAATLSWLSCVGLSSARSSSCLSRLTLSMKPRSGSASRSSPIWWPTS